MKLISLNWIQLKKLRENLKKKQNRICLICKKNLTNPVLDHHHKKRIKGTGRCRGVICSTCNIFLAKIENNCIRYCIGYSQLPEILRNIALYLEMPQTEYIHPSEREFEKIGKREYNELKKKYFKEYPNRKAFPKFPKSKKLTKRLAEIKKDLK